MRKIVLFLFFFWFLFIIHNTLLIIPARAEGEFITEVNVEYNVQESGVTEIKHNINLKNVFSDIYATNYSLVLDNITPVNIKAYQTDQNLSTSVKTEGSKVLIEVSFPDAVVGKDKSRLFSISYEDNAIATRTGEVWEIVIPRISKEDLYKSYNISLSVPAHFGTEAYISPKSIKKIADKGRVTYQFDKNAVLASGITAAFGDFQIFSFSLVYHLENPLNKTAFTEIAIPPDTSLQKIYYEQLEPKPENITIDGDGNWIAKYILKSRERIDVQAKGTVQIFSGPRPFSSPSQVSLNNNLKASEYWQSEDPEIIKLASELKTPKNIYDFVTKKLKYNLDRVKPNVTRLGAIEALKQSENAICMEYTDLFIALARAAGIPAREINGFAYTENKDIQPLSLVSDVLHSWPEYWDSSKNTWISIDPTWGSTTGGVDFYNKLDLRHFAFVIHGNDPKKPYPPGSYKLGSNPQKDVFVNFGRLPETRNPILNITYQKEKLIPFLPQKIKININNLGPMAYYNFKSEVFSNGVNFTTKNSEVLLPFSSYEFEIKIPSGLFGSKTSSLITVRAGSASIDIPSSKKEIIIYDLIVLFLLFLTVLTSILIKLGKIKPITAINFVKSLIKLKKPDNGKIESH